jgi:hypothetical protein
LQNVLKLIGNRIVSLRLTLVNVIGGWSLISSSLRYHQTTLLQRLHLIDIKPHEFDKLLRNDFIKQLHTLLVDITPSNLFNCLQVEGVYLVKVKNDYSLLFYVENLIFIYLIKDMFTNASSKNLSTSI